MNEIAIGQLIWFCIGAAAGATLCAGWVLSRGGRFAPEVEMPQTIEPDPQLSITVDWALITAALKGAGMTAVYTEDAPKVH